MLITAGLISQQKQDKALQKPIRKKSSTKLHFFLLKTFIEELADNNQFYILFIVSGCTLCRDQHLDKKTLMTAGLVQMAQCLRYQEK